VYQLWPKPKRTDVSPTLLKGFLKGPRRIQNASHGRTGYLVERSRQTGPLLTMLCGAIFLASALVGAIEALVLDQEASALASAPVCTSTAATAGCRLEIGAVVRGYDEGSGVARERHRLCSSIGKARSFVLGRPPVGFGPALQPGD
jgi:hypothetical protein